MDQQIDILVIEDSEPDAFLLIRELSRHLPNIHHIRVDDLEGLNGALEKKWDIILCDFNLPQFDGLTALHLLRERGIDTPFILVSGVVEEGIAASMMSLGASDYIMKDNLKRLAPAVIRELAEAKLRNELRAATVNKSKTQIGEETKDNVPEVPSAAADVATTTPTRDDRRTELLEFIEASRKQLGLGKFITERHKAIVNILYVAGIIKRHQDKILEREGLTEQQFNLLRILKRRYPHEASINQLREEILSKTTDVSRLIERMSILGMINYAKNAKDKRFRNISITEKGLKMLDEMNKCMDEMFFSELQLSEMDARIVNAKMKKLMDQIEEE